MKKSHPLRDAIRARLVERAATWGYNKADVEQVLDGLESERSILDWLKNGGFESLLKLVLELLPLFLVPNPTTASESKPVSNSDWGEG